MTTSLYVMGEMTDTEKVIVDVGTGYYVEKVCRNLHIRSYKSRAIQLVLGKVADFDLLES